MSEERRVFGLSEDDLVRIDPVELRTLLHERTHHTIEVLLYRILAGKLKPPSDLGDTVELLLRVWKRRGLPTDTPDLKWSERYLDIAKKVKAGKKVKLGEEMPKPFSKREMETVRKLVYERRSIRMFEARPVSEATVRKILHAGLMAPQGCNLGSTRFLVLRDPQAIKLLKSDIPVENAVVVVICQDMRTYRVVGHDVRNPQNVYFDAAAAADHILLMAHALGLGGVWLTHGEEVAKAVRERFNLPEYYRVPLHIAIGWPAEAPIKSQRMRVEEAIISGEG